MVRSAAAALCLGLGLALFTAPADAKTFRIRPGADAQTQLQTALIEAKPGDTVKLDDGRFELTAGLSLDVDRVTVRGAGQNKSVLSFTGQTAGAEGLLVTSDDVTLRDFAVENARGDGIKSKDANRITFRDLRVEWTRGPNPSNGAYGVYPVGSRDVLIDRVTVRGASDAGIYVGQSQNIIVRRSLAEFNVAGIEIENSIGADVYDNIARRNTGGILVFDLPGVPQTGGHSTRIFRNQIQQNDTPNFAPAGNIVAGVPTGTGVIVMANRNVHIFENQISENGTANVIITAYRQEITDPSYNPLPRDVVVRNNEFGRGGFAPAAEFGALRQAGVPFGDIVWDGATVFVAGGRPRDEPVRISVKDNRTTTGKPLGFLSLGLAVASSPLTDAQPDATMPAPLIIPEPAAIRVPQD